MAKFGYFASGSSLALALTLGLWSNPALAQPAPAAPTAAAPEEAPAEEVVEITGSFIRGTPEDSAIPVHATTLKELQNLGSPSNMDLVKSMTDSTGVRGEGDRRSAGSTVGAQSINLRSIGESRTVVLFNGRRLQDQSSAGVRFNNIAWIPNAAIGRVDTLRDGGATTYGADAIAGVVNFITRHDFDGIKVRSNYRAIEKSDGNYDLDVLAGSTSDVGNVMLMASFQHVSTLRALDRPWAERPYLNNDNVTTWAPAGQPGAFTLNTTFSTATGLAGGAITPAGSAGLNTLYSPTVAGLAPGVFVRQMGSSGLIRDPGCAALGGFQGFSSTSSPSCYFHVGQADKLAEETNTAQVYAEMNFNVTDNFKVHTEAAYYQLKAPDVINTPSETTNSNPQVRITCSASNVPAGIGCTTAGQIVIGAGSQGTYFVPGSNPAVASILGQLKASDGASSVLSAAQINAIVNSGGISLTSWRPFGNQGNPLSGPYEINRNQTDQIRLNAELTGDLPKVFGTNLQWTTAATYTRTIYSVYTRDILVDRLQQALNGLGGPNCDANPSTPGIVDTKNAGGAVVPGAGVVGSALCSYFNPFSNGIKRNFYDNSLPDNPGYVGTGSFTGYTPGQGLANSYDLQAWLFTPVNLDRSYDTVLLDSKVSGDIPVELPGGPISIALGGQYRYQKEVFIVNDVTNRAINPCPTIGAVNCTTATSPLEGNRQTGVLAQSVNENRYYPVASVFGEVNIPFFDNFNLDASMRYEKFISDVTLKDTSVLVPQIASKWQVTDNFALRATAGSTFSQVNPPRDDGPAVAQTLANGSFGIGAPGASSILTYNYDHLDVKPETGFNYNAGFLYKQGPFRLSVDYYNIKINDLAQTLTATNVVNGLVVQNTGGVTPAAGPGNLINCSSPLLSALDPGLGNKPVVQLTGPNCVQGHYNASGVVIEPAGTVSILTSPGVTSGGTPAGFGQANGGQAVINYYGGVRELNSGSLNTDGIDVSTSLDFHEVLGGDLTLTADVTQVLNWQRTGFVVGGVTVAPGYDGLGSLNESPAKSGAQIVPEYKATYGFNYNHGRHNVNVSTRWTSTLTQDNTSLFTETAARNANVGDSAGVVTCPVVDPNLTVGETGNPTSTVTPGTYVPGSGVFASALVSGIYGFCSGYNTTITGQSNGLPATFNTDISYRLSLPGDTVFQATVQNVADADPEFARNSTSYNSFTGSPLGRTIRVGIEKKF